jgi:uncharacterized tellurite resistance protein B-like protein
MNEKIVYLPADLNEFKLFVFIMLANADHKMELSEINYLFERLDEETFSNNLPNNELLVGRVFKAWHSMVEPERLSLVKQQLDLYFLSVNDHQGAIHFLNHLHDIIMADGNISSEEQQLFEKIQGFLLNP